MTDGTHRPEPQPERDDDPHTGIGSSDGFATWQKAAGIIGLAVVLLLAIQFLSGGHGPARHLPGGGAEQPSDSPATQGHVPPSGRH